MFAPSGNWALLAIILPLGNNMGCLSISLGIKSQGVGHVDHKTSTAALRVAPGQQASGRPRAAEKIDGRFRIRRRANVEARDVDQSIDGWSVAPAESQSRA